MKRNLAILASALLALLSTHAVFAEEFVTAPTLEGGVTAEIGTFYAVPSTSGGTYYHDDELNDPEYDLGVDASLGYLFEDSANSVELSYRGLNTQQ